MAPTDEESGSRKRLRGLLAAFFIGSGVNHFVIPRPYEQIVPPRLQGQAKLLVQISGVAEVAGGLGVLLPSTRRLSGVGLIRAFRQDSPLGAVWAAAAAAADDVVGVAGDAQLRDNARWVCFDAAMFD
jgi:hypothetical protein